LVARLPRPRNRCQLAADYAITPGWRSRLLYLHTVSPLSDVASVHLLIADYAAADPTGKVNIIGGEIAIVGRPTGAPTTSPFFLVASVAVPPDYYDQEAIIEIALQEMGGDIVILPGATPDLPSTPILIRQIAKFTEPTAQAQLLLPERFKQGYLRGRVQIVVGFPSGLPLTAGEGYVWRVRVDGETGGDWTREFVVAEQIPAAPPSIGSGAAPS
jgi:hypothetical protein